MVAMDTVAERPEGPKSMEKMTKNRVTPTLILPILGREVNTWSHKLFNHAVGRSYSSSMPMIHNDLKHNFMHNHIVL